MQQDARELERVRAVSGVVTQEEVQAAVAPVAAVSLVPSLTPLCTHGLCHVTL